VACTANVEPGWNQVPSFETKHPAKIPTSNNPPREDLTRQAKWPERTYQPMDPKRCARSRKQNNKVGIIGAELEAPGR
jgi:hypothetical protein